MSDIAIRVENLGKRYRIRARQKQAATRREALRRFVASPFDWLISTLRGPSEEEIIWALRDVSFEVKVGEVLEVLSNDSGTKKDIPVWAKKVGHEYLGHIEADGYDKLYVKRNK